MVIQGCHLFIYDCVFISCADDGGYCWLLDMRLAFNVILCGYDVFHVIGKTFIVFE